MCTQVCSLPVTLSHLGHPSCAGSHWQCPGPLCRVVALLLTTASTHPGRAQSSPCSSMHLLGVHQSLSKGPSTSHGPPSPPAPLPLPDREGSVWDWQPAPTHCPPRATWACCPGTLSLLTPPAVGAWGQGSCGVCPPPALDKHSRMSPCCQCQVGWLCGGELCWEACSCVEGSRTWHGLL